MAVSVGAVPCYAGILFTRADGSTGGDFGNL
jgi:hypothetical protein